MRELEFRAWDKVRNRMLTSAKFVEFKVINGVLSAVNYDRSGKEQVLEVVQYTGLKDASGVKIFEGDIIQIGKTSSHILRVEFINAYVGGWVLTHEDSSKWLSLGAREDYELTVIGNIYETPELLK
tara:strand:- start:16641 stop:17018 length:378 start_codon:yes stop_codon:yes gene_type:complete